MKFGLILFASYGPFASSALAGQNLARESTAIYSLSVNPDFFCTKGNITALSFPLFTQQMYHRLGIPWANTLFAFIALALMPIPFVSHTHTSGRFFVLSMC